MILVSVVMIMGLFLFQLVRLLATPIYDLDVVVQDRGDDRNHVCLHYPGPHSLRSSDTNVHNTLKRQIPLPNAHHVPIPALLEDADKAFDTPIHGQNIADTCRRRCKIGKMVKRIDQRQSRGAVECSAIV
jgi:hypothetical protein